MKELYETGYKRRFSFGKNWRRFLRHAGAEHLRHATASLRTSFGGSLRGKTFLDLGCGSGLFSLAAVRLGAKRVVSVDVDDESIRCAQYLRTRHRVPPRRWTIRQGSALDKRFMGSLGTFDAVYSWGVLHHTGDLRAALANAGSRVRRNGLFCLAIYNTVDSPFPYGTSGFWRRLKRAYATGGVALRRCIKTAYVSYYFVGLLATLRNPYTYVRHYPARSRRGMDFWRDVDDWLGGYPYESATPAEITTFFSRRDFTTARVAKVRGLGCNEFLLKRRGAA